MLSVAKKKKPHLKSHIFDTEVGRAVKHLPCLSLVELCEMRCRADVFQLYSEQKG